MIIFLIILAFLATLTITLIISVLYAVAATAYFYIRERGHEETPAPPEHRSILGSDDHDWPIDYDGDGLGGWSS